MKGVSVGASALFGLCGGGGVQGNSARPRQILAVAVD